MDLVLESTGRFTDRDQAALHLTAGAKKVIISAPAKKEDITIVYGVNHTNYDPAKHHVISNASCTTNCLVPVVKVILDRFGFVSGFMTTVHSYTNDQVRSSTCPTRTSGGPAPPRCRSFLPRPARPRPRRWSSRRSRARSTASRSGCRRPTSRSWRSPAWWKRRPRPMRSTTAFREAAKTGPLKGILAVSDEPLVSVDYIGSLQSSTVDALSTNVVNGTLVNVTSWYDNEMGYSARCVDLLRYVGQRL